MTINDLKSYKVVGIAPPSPAAPATPAPTVPQPKATFPATPEDSTGTIVAKTIGNIPSSAVGFGKSVLDFLNPLNAAKKVQDLAGGLAENQAKPGAPSVSDVVKEI